MLSSAKDKRTLTIDDITRIKTVEDARISPDGQKAAFVIRTANMEKNQYESNIYLVSTSGGEATRLTDDVGSQPRWSPDGGKLVFAKTVDGKRGIWLIDLHGQNKRRLTDFDVSNAHIGSTGESVCWSPNGSRIAFVASNEPVEKDENIRVVRRLMYKALFGYSDMRRRHIFVVSPLGHEPPRQLTFGDFDEHSICWSSDGKEIVFVSNRTGKDDFNMHTDLWAVRVDGGNVRRITETEGAEYSPTWSPDGRRIAYLARTRANTSNESTPEDAHVWVINSDGSGAKDLTVDLDRACGAPQWSHDGSHILFAAGDHGRTMIYSVDPRGGTVSRITDGDRTLGSVSIAQEADRMIYVSNEPTNPSELYSAEGDGKNEVKLTSLNAWLDEIHLSEPEEVTLQGFDGTPLQGWILKPKGFDPSKKYPALLNIKGGPAGMSGYSWNVYHQIPPAYGYIEFHVNYRGSTGYGQAFSDASVEDMLGGDFRDNMAVVDYVLRTRSYLDADRMGVWGGSYGGYLTNWIVTQTNRFKAAVSISSISNLFTQWAGGAIPLWLEVEIEGLPWDRMDLMLKQSPIMQANRVKTPVLFVHGELDFDTPIVEAEQMFMALLKYGVETEMVRYTDEGHGIRRKPANHIDVLRRVLEWFDRHLSGCVQST